MTRLRPRHLWLAALPLLTLAAGLAWAGARASTTLVGGTCGATVQADEAAQSRLLAQADAELRANDIAAAERHIDEARQIAAPLLSAISARITCRHRAAVLIAVARTAEPVLLLAALTLLIAAIAWAERLIASPDAAPSPGRPLPAGAGGAGGRGGRGGRGSAIDRPARPVDGRDRG